MNRRRFKAVHFFVSLGVLHLIGMLYFNEWRNGISRTGDTWGYYAYLPALFIHNDLSTLETTFSTRLKYNPYYVKDAENPLTAGEATHVGNGKQVIKYTMGVAVLCAPFLLIAHILAAILGFPMDGYSLPYQLLIHFSSIFYTLLGSYFLYKILRQYFNQYWAALSVLCLTLASNLLYFNMLNAPMSHSYLFALYAIVMYASAQWYKHFQVKYAFIIGFCCGLTCLIRPTEILIIFIPLLYGIVSFKDIKQRLQTIYKHYKTYLAAIVLFVMGGLPQLIYWKWQTGNWLYYSYGEEGFNFSEPHIWQGLFSFKNGWLIYTPIMFLALLGIQKMWQKKNPFSLALCLVLPLHIYISYSWWCWNYINGFGSRAMISIYALLAIPLAYSLYHIYKSKWRFAKYLLVTFVVGVMMLNVFQTWQFKHKIMWSENANAQYYRAIFGQISLSYEAMIALDTNEKQPNINNKNWTKINTLLHRNFEDETAKNYTNKEAQKGEGAFEIKPSTTYGAAFKTDYKSLVKKGIKGGDWLKVEVWAKALERNSDFYNMTRMVTTFQRDGKDLKWKGVRIGNKFADKPFIIWKDKKGVWKRIVYYTQIPENLKNTDRLKIYFWNIANKSHLLLDEQKIEVWRKNN